LRCADGSYYTGITRRSVDERVSEHAQGLIDGYTSRRLPVELVFSESYERVDDAIAAERRIKGLVAGEEGGLSARRFRTSVGACWAQSKKPVILRRPI